MCCRKCHRQPCTVAAGAVIERGIMTLAPGNYSLLWAPWNINAAITFAPTERTYQWLRHCRAVCPVLGQRLAIRQGKGQVDGVSLSLCDGHDLSQRGAFGAFQHRDHSAFLLLRSAFGLPAGFSTLSAFFAGLAFLAGARFAFGCGTSGADAFFSDFGLVVHFVSPDRPAVVTIHLNGRNSKANTHDRCAGHPS